VIKDCALFGEGIVDRIVFERVGKWVRKFALSGLHASKPENAALLRPCKVLPRRYVEDVNMRMNLMLDVIVNSRIELARPVENVRCRSDFWTEDIDEGSCAASHIIVVK